MRPIKEGFISAITGFLGEQTSPERLTLRSLHLNSHLLAHEVFQYVRDRDQSIPISLAILLALEDNKISELLDTPKEILNISPKVTLSERRFNNPFYMRPGHSISIRHDYYPLEKDTIPLIHKITITHHKMRRIGPTQTYLFVPTNGRYEEKREDEINLSEKNIFKRDIVTIYP